MTQGVKRTWHGMPIWLVRVVARSLIAGWLANWQRAADGLLAWLLGKHLAYQKYHALGRVPGNFTNTW